MTRESAQTKAERYVLAGRVVVQQAGPRRVRAIVRGDGYLWPVTFDSSGWRCPCPARATCCHLVAVQLVTAPGVPS